MSQLEQANTSSREILGFCPRVVTTRGGVLLEIEMSAIWTERHENRALKFVEDPERKQRDEFLRSIGFASYSEYVDSELWKGWIRNEIEDGSYRWECVLCKKNSATIWHHQHYEAWLLVGSLAITSATRDLLRGELAFHQFDLIKVCEFCHSIIHRGVDGEWFTMEIVRKRSQALFDLHSEKEYKDIVLRDWINLPSE